MATDLLFPGFICAFHFLDGRAVALTEQDPIPDRLSGEGFIWLHLGLSDGRCQKWLRDVLGISAEMAADFCRPATRQYLGEAHGWLIGSLGDFLREFDMDSAAHAWLHVLANGKVLVTGRTRAVQSVERLRRDLAMGRLVQSPMELLGQLLANYPDTLDAILHRLLGELELIEDHVLEEQHRGERRRLMLLRRETAQLHRHMRALRRTMLAAERGIEQKLPQLTAIVSRLTNHDQDFEAMEQRAPLLP